MGYKKVNDDSLILLADAIREKGGTNESLTFPDGFIAAVESIGGTGCTLVVTAPPSVIVTVVRDTDSFTRTTDESGVATFTGLSTGTWTIEINNGSQTASRAVVITADYAVSIAFFAATITITYPAGSTCTCSDGVTTLTAPDTSGVWECIVSNAGTWTVVITDGTDTAEEVVEITTDGQIEDVYIDYTFYLYKDGKEFPSRTGGLMYVKIGDLMGGNAEPIVTKNADNMVITSPGGGGAKFYEKKFDMSNFSKLCFEGTMYASGYQSSRLKFGVWGKTSGNPVAGLQNEYNKTEPLKIPVDTLSGEHYVGFWIQEANSKITVKKVWLE